MLEKLFNLQLSFPVRVLALVITITLFIGATLFSLWVGKGTVTISVDQPNGYVVIDTVQHDTPYTATLRAGRKIISVGSIDYSEQEEHITVPTFLQKRNYNFQLSNKLLYKYDSLDTKSAIEAKYPWAKELPYVSNDFEVEIPTSDDTFDITLGPTVFTAPGTDPVELDKILKADKKKALDWLKSKGAKTDELKINWIPYDPDNPPQ